jgi:dUTP pyrophosphatase
MSIITSEQAYKLGWFFTNTDTTDDITVDMNRNSDYSNSVKDITSTFDTLDSDRKIDFLRGIIDRRAALYLMESVKIPSKFLSEQILNEITASYVVEDDTVVWYGINALELLASIYSNITTNPLQPCSQKTYNTFITWTIPSGMLRLRPITFKWSRINDTVPPPSKNRFSDSGFDLHLVSKLKEDNGVHYYDTGIRVEPENGYYFELVGRSSISKTGWMLANNIGIIDASYRGTIIVPLIKVNPDASPLSLPLRLVQIIPRPLILMMGTETSDLSNTARGTGGFGSSGK